MQVFNCLLVTSVNPKTELKSYLDLKVKRNFCFNLVFYEY